MTPTDTQIFTLPNAKRKVALVMVGNSVFVIGVYIYGVSDMQGDALIPVMGAFLVLLLLAISTWAWWITNKFSLTISPDGIEHRRPFISLYARWDDIQHIGEFTYHSKSRSYTDTGLYIKSDHAKMHIYKHFIPLSHFAPKGDWRHHEIGALVRQYAPHIFKDESRKIAE